MSAGRSDAAAAVAPRVATVAPKQRSGACTVEAAIDLVSAEGPAVAALAAVVAAAVAVLALQSTAILFTVPREVLDRYSVDKAQCGGCECWDGLSKAPYDKGRFKFVYFNSEPQTVGLLAIVVLYVLMFDRALRSIACAALAGRADWVAVAAFAVSVPGVTYGAAMMYHYINDSSFGMMPTQLYFTVTETMTAACIVRVATLPAGQPAAAAARDAAVRALCVWMVWIVALTHVVLAGLDQIVLDLFVRSSDVSRHAYARAVVFSVSDMLLLAWASGCLGMFACLGVGSRPWPGWARLGAAAGVAAAVCAGYRLLLPLV